jgi:hypothetical protein
VWSSHKRLFGFQGIAAESQLSPLIEALGTRMKHDADTSVEQNERSQS